MAHLALLFLVIGLLAPHTPTGVVLRSVTDLLSANSGWEMDPNGSPTPSDPSSDRGWEIDPNG